MLSSYTEATDNEAPNGQAEAIDSPILQAPDNLSSYLFCHEELKEDLPKDS